MQGNAMPKASLFCSSGVDGHRAAPMLMEFLASTYEAVADLAKWDRAALECDLGQAGVVGTV